MLVVRVELLHGTFRATGASDLTLTGQSAPEWPPSPARVYQALVAGGGTGGRGQGEEGVAGLDLLEAPPEIYAVTSRDAPANDLQPRYVVVDATVDGAVQEYPGRKAQQVRPGARVCPAVPVVAYVWPDVDPTPEQVAALRVRAARVPYLGAADSPARVQVGTDPALVPEDLPRWLADPDGDTVLPVAYPGFLDALDAAFEDWTAGRPRRGAWTPRQLAAYRSPGPDPDPGWPVGPTVWLRFDTALRGRRVVAVADTLRAALLNHAGRLAGGPDAVPQVIHGHHPAGTQGTEHCRILPLPNAGFPHSDGRIHGACVWFPPGTDNADVELARAALARVGRLVRPGEFDVAVTGFDGSRAPWSSNPDRWRGPARRWVSVFPAVFERRLRGELTLPELERWCTWAGLPEPVEFRISRVPLLPGAVSLRPSETTRDGDHRPYAHLDITFDRPVTGPVAVGRGRHFGLGLMAPAADHAAARNPDLARS